MAFLDNSGDIILDAVLTDTGRMRLARGDGSFRIAKFALGDDEVDYSLYQNANHTDGAHTSGSAYYDLQILQTPVLEAFTNNTSTMKSTLLTVAQTNLLFLPEIVLSTDAEGGLGALNTSSPNQNMFLVAVDNATETQLVQEKNTYGTIQSFMKGFHPDAPENHVILDQGLNSTEAGSNSEDLDGELVETQYIIEMDNRLGQLVNLRGRMADVSFIDDDQVAVYYLSLSNDRTFIENLGPRDATDTSFTTSIAGRLGTRLQFSIKSSQNLRTSTHFFTRLGGTITINSISYRNIDTTVRVTGGTTGYRVDVPVRFLKKV